MVQAMVFSKDSNGSVGVFHSCDSWDEAWTWVRRQHKDGKNVLVVSGEDIDLAMRIFGANKGGAHGSEDF